MSVSYERVIEADCAATFRGFRCGGDPHDTPGMHSTDPNRPYYVEWPEELRDDPTDA